MATWETLPIFRDQKPNFMGFGPCARWMCQIYGSTETWPSGRRRSPAKGVYRERYRGFESLRLRHYPLFLLDKLATWDSYPTKYPTKILRSHMSHSTRLRCARFPILAGLQFHLEKTRPYRLKLRGSDRFRLDQSQQVAQLHRNVPPRICLGQI